MSKKINCAYLISLILNISKFRSTKARINIFKFHKVLYLTAWLQNLNIKHSHIVTLFQAHLDIVFFSREICKLEFPPRQVFCKRVRKRKKSALLFMT